MRLPELILREIITKSQLIKFKLFGNSLSNSKEYQLIKKIRTIEELEKFKEEYLKKLLLHAYNNVPYYNKIFKKIKIIKNGEVSLSKFSEIPILTKEKIRKNYKELLSKDYENRKWYKNSSGGSTGQTLSFVQDENYVRWGLVTQYYYYKKILSIDEPNAKRVVLWGSDRDTWTESIGLKQKISKLLSNMILLNSFKMDKNDLKKYVKIINAFKPDVIRGYTSSLFEFCNYARKENIELHKPKVIISSAEKLGNIMRRGIERSFKAKVYDFYGSRETNNLAGECKSGQKHLLSFHNHVEIIDDRNNKVKEGKTGRVIVTNLHNYSMPLIRYENEDTAIAGPKKCKCGSILPTIKKITGRISDHFLLKDGTIIHGECITRPFYFNDWIKRFKAVQEDYNKVRIFVVLNNKMNPNKKKGIDSQLKIVMGKKCNIKWEFVDEIPKTKSGKYLYTQSLLRKRE